MVAPASIVKGRRSWAGQDHRVAALDVPSERLPEQRDRLRPAEDLLHQLPLPLADRVAAVAGRPAVDRTPPAGRVLGDVAGDPQGPEPFDETGGEGVPSTYSLRRVAIDLPDRPDG
jgi:hypothetical protein